MKSLSQELRDWIDRLDQLTAEDPQGDEGYAAKLKLTSKGAANLSLVVQYLSSPQVGGKVVRHPRFPDTVVFVPKETISDSSKFIDYFEKLSDALSQQLGFQPFKDFTIAAAEPFQDLSSI